MDYKLLSALYYEDKNAYEELYLSRFSHESTYHIPIQIHDFEAFFTIPQEVIELLTGIYKKDKELTHILSMLPDIALEQFKLKSIVDEIKISNDLESVYSTRKEIRELLVPQENNKKRLYGLVQKYSMLSTSEEICIHSCKDIRTIYDELVLPEVVEEDPNNAPDGVFFRKESVNVQAKNMKIVHRGVTPEDNIIAYMDACIDLLNGSYVNPMIIIAVVHYLIGYIHPFYDGNGRLNRFISSAYLSKELHPLVGYSISNTIKQHIDSYYKAFKTCNDMKNRGDVTPFVIYFLDVIYQSMVSLNNTLMDKIQRLKYYANKIETLSVSERVAEFTFILFQNSLFGEDGLTVEQCAQIQKVSESTIRNYISQLPKDLLLVSKNGYTKLYDVNLSYWD